MRGYLKILFLERVCVYVCALAWQAKFTLDPLQQMLFYIDLSNFWYIFICIRGSHRPNLVALIGCAFFGAVALTCIPVSLQKCLYLAPSFIIWRVLMYLSRWIHSCIWSQMRPSSSFCFFIPTSHITLNIGQRVFY